MLFKESEFIIDIRESAKAVTKLMIKIMFVCHGNICRSTMAEYVLKDMVRRRGLADQFEIASSATSREEIGSDIHVGTKRKLRQMGIPFEHRQAVQLRNCDYQNYDHLIAMDHQNVANMLRIIGTDPADKVRLLLDYTGEHSDIADPWYTGDFDKTYDDVVRGCEALLLLL